MRNKIILLGVLGIFVAVALVLGISYQINAQMQRQEDEISKEQFMDFQGQWYDYMNQRGMNPGEMMGGGAMNRDQFMSFQGEMFDLMGRYGLDPVMMMKSCVCAGMSK